MAEKKDVIILSIETSCDETSVALVKNGRWILSNVISSQIEIHKPYGGVVPEIASRHHLENINKVTEKALKDSDLTFSHVDVVAVTYGPGLVGALLIGIATAKAYAYSLSVPLVGVDHMASHMAANYIEHKDLKPPFTSLIISGGHTQLVRVKDYNLWEILGETRDDAVGEAFDKVARILGLGYPGGPLVEEAALTGDSEKVYFKRVYLEKDSYDFSFSGVKTAVLNYVNSNRQKDEEININDIAAGFQEAVFTVLVDKSIRAAKEEETGKLVIAGGVAANKRLRELLRKRCYEEGLELYYPQLLLSTDNAAMVGSAGYYLFKEGKVKDLDLDAYPNLRMDHGHNLC
ncbi:MAG: tRNA (adenosine(37)-N6)-threonylcarbamoyltransferase complex transferase subunit TsaD [Clostridiales bacterium]|nr:tRNA (adenosine(37)-N6)-threonylcarbamoyltransferase complex transferase subunit TsaD [Clostridiales bacterium]